MAKFPKDAPKRRVVKALERLVCELYESTEKEIAVVEESAQGEPWPQRHGCRFRRVAGTNVGGA